MMDAIKELVTGQLGMMAGAALVAFVTGRLSKKTPEMMELVRNTVGELGEAMLEVAAALNKESDGGSAITKKELDGIVNESKNVIDQVSKIINLKREKKIAAVVNAASPGSRE